MESDDNGLRITGRGDGQQEVETFPLDEALISLIADLRTAQQRLTEQAISISSQERGALILFLRQHKLAGNWDVAPNGREIVRKESAPAPQETP